MVPEVLLGDQSFDVSTGTSPLYPSEHPESPFQLMHGDTNADTAWLLVGVAQAEAAAACEPEGVAIYCVDARNFFAPMAPEGLDAIEGKDVLIFPKGDAATDHTVFDRSTSFGRICMDEGAASVSFVWLSADLDDHLADRDLEARRSRLQRAATRTGKKPAKAKPPAPSAAEQKAEVARAELEREALLDGRPVVDVSRDSLEVLNDLVAALKNGPDGDRLFSLGGELAHLGRGSENGAVEASIVDVDKLLFLLPHCARMVSVTSRGVKSAWPERNAVGAFLAGFQKDFPKLRGIAPTPIVRKDNTIATEDGYDPQSQVLLDLAGLELDVPDAPTEDDVSAAVSLLLDEWLGDFPFAGDADRANVLALILSYPLRELVTLVPLAVISAKSKGTGKSKLLSLIVYLFTRSMPAWDSLPSSEEETRKQITTLLSTASPFIGFDESPVVGGKSINRLLTAQTWSDRMLGSNKRAELPNRAVMASTGNNVQVLGDTGRRYYPIELFYDGEHPENRPESDFRHPDIEAWTEAHRAPLLSAVFTLIRAWQVAGRPKKSTSFGSFERWEAVVGGVIANAGVEGFLSNLAAHREFADYDESLWVAHCEWLSRAFPAGRFTVSDVIGKMTRSAGTLRMVDQSADLPPSVDGSPLDPGYAKKLGRAYRDRVDGWFGGYRFRQAPTKTGNKVTWILEVSPTVLQARADAAADAKAVAAQQQLDRVQADIAASIAALPERRERLAALEAAGRGASIDAEILRLEIQTAELRSAAAAAPPNESEEIAA